MTGIVRHPCGPRVYVGGLRIHHGLAGCGLAAVGIARRYALLSAVGIALVLHDRADFPWRDCDNHPG